MIGEFDPRRRTAPYRELGDADDPRARPSGPSGLHRFLGGSPVAVFVKLLFLSVLVGAGMAMFGVTPILLFQHLYEAARALIDLGLDTFHDFGRWILAGAVVVIPLWLISRVLMMGK